jgi:hypothetical protein
MYATLIIDRYNHSVDVRPHRAVPSESAVQHCHTYVTLVMLVVNYPANLIASLSINKQLLTRPAPTNDT